SCGQCGRAICEVAGPCRAPPACPTEAEMAAEFDFSRLPRQRVPRVVVSPRRIVADILSKGWVESLIPFAALLCAVIGVLVATDGYFSAANLRNLAQYSADGGLVVLALL